MYIYTDASGEVVARSSADRSLAEAQAMAPELGIVARIEGPPAAVALGVKGRAERLGGVYHRLKSGFGGTATGDYDEIQSTTNPHELRIGKYLSRPQILHKPPKDRDWRRIAVHVSKLEQAYGAFGEVTEWLWCPSIEGVVMTDEPIVRETHEYDWDPQTFVPRFRIETIAWLTVGGDEHPDTKVRYKTYDTAAKIAKEGQTRRGRLMDRVLGTVHGWALTGAPGAPAVTDLLAFSARPDIYASRTLFVYDSNPQIVLDVHGDVSEAWLDAEIAPGMTARAYITSALNIYGILLP